MIDVEAVIQQFELLPPEEKRKFLARVAARKNSGSSGGDATDFDQLVSEGILAKRDGLWVITGEIGDSEDLVTKERERRMRELVGE